MCDRRITTGMNGDPVKFHSARAAAELDLAMNARHAAAARAHFGLSALHLQRVERLIEPSDTGPPTG